MASDTNRPAGPSSARTGPWSHGVSRFVRFGVVAALCTYGAATGFLVVHVLSMPELSLAGLGFRTVILSSFGDFFGSHVGVTDGVVLGVARVGTVPAPVYVLVPPLLLGWCGRACTRSVPVGTSQEAFLAGAGVAVGYAPVVGLFLTALLGIADFGIAGLDPVRAFLLAGVGFPLFFGGLGGLSTRFV